MRTAIRFGILAFALVVLTWVQIDRCKSRAKSEVREHTHYKVKMRCDNCNEVSYHSVPLGTNIVDFEAITICPNCGIKGYWQ
jgi:transcription elongation factor Elf1